MTQLLHFIIFNFNAPDKGQILHPVLKSPSIKFLTLPFKLLTCSSVHVVESEEADIKSKRMNGQVDPPPWFPSV